jgi:hypothetical protein
MNEATWTPKVQQAANIQRERIRLLMLDGMLRTLAEISQAVGAPEASVSARLRDLRKAQYGGYTVNRFHKGPDGRTWFYQVLEPGFLFSTKSTQGTATAHL